MDGLDKSRARAEQALAASGLFPHAIVAVRPLPDRHPIYWILEASLEPGPTTEESLCMRSAGRNRFSPEYEAIRKIMDC